MQTPNTTSSDSRCVPPAAVTDAAKDMIGPRNTKLVPWMLSSPEPPEPRRRVNAFRVGKWERPGDDHRWSDDADEHRQHMLQSHQHRQSQWRSLVQAVQQIAGRFRCLGLDVITHPAIIGRATIAVASFHRRSRRPIGVSTPDRTNAAMDST